MDPELRELLARVSSNTSDGTYTHSTFFGNSARWNIENNNNKVFWETYCHLAHRTMTDETRYHDPICLAEKPTKEMPLIVDFEFKFHDDDSDFEPYDDNLIGWLCHLYQKVLSENFQLKDGTNFLEETVVILESKTHWEETTQGSQEGSNKILCMNLRLHFPYARINIDLQNNLIRPKIIQLLRNNNIRSKLYREPIGDWESIIRIININTPIMMYGSCDSPGKPKLELQSIWPHISEEMLDSEAEIAGFNLSDSFVPSLHSHVASGTFGDYVFQEDSIQFWLPMFLSVGYYNSILMPKNRSNDISSMPFSLPKKNRDNNKRYSQEDDEDELVIAETLLMMVNPSRLLTEIVWLEIGQALYSCTNGEETGALVWIRFTEKALQGEMLIPSFLLRCDNNKNVIKISDLCKETYDTFSTTRKTVKTIAWYAREDSPQQYAAWHRNWCLDSMTAALSMSHTDVAVCLYRIYWLDFAYCPVGKGKWFQFPTHRWKESNQGIELRKVISREFRRKFEDFRLHLLNNAHESDNDNLRDDVEKTTKLINALIFKLKTVGFKSSIMTEVSEHFNFPDFITILDTDEDLLPVPNGVLHMIGDTVTFRKGKPEDYVSICANVPFKDNFTWDHPHVQEVMTWYGQVYCDPELLDCYLKFNASVLRGGNKDKSFTIMSGEQGNNSKSMIVKSYECVYGPFCIKIPIGAVTEKALSSSSPSPQFARAKNTRIAFLDEPEDDIPMQKGTVKRLTGGDSFFARHLQENGADIKSTFKLVLVCNKVPIFANPDPAIKKRTNILPHFSEWVEDAPADINEQYAQRKFKMNILFDKRIPILAPAILWIAVMYYPKYVNEGINYPEIVKQYTESYWRDNDIYAQFAADTIQEVYNPETGQRDANARVTLTDVYKQFKLWYRDAFPGVKVPERSAVKAELSSRWGRIVNGCWVGISIIQSGQTGDLNTLFTGPTMPVKPVETQKPIPPLSPQSKLLSPSLTKILPTLSPSFGKSLPSNAMSQIPIDLQQYLNPSADIPIEQFKNFNILSPIVKI